MADPEQQCMTVRSVMTANPVCVDPETPLRQAVNLLRDHKIRHLAVTSPPGRVRGLVSNRDMLVAHMQVSHGGLRIERRVGEIMTREVDSITPDACAYAAARYMYGQKRGCLLVIEQGTLVGILTEADFMRAFAKASGCRCKAAVEQKSG
ncbi:MAG: CBS domain-containing protein [Burkholderiales bacterium]